MCVALLGGCAENFSPDFYNEDEISDVSVTKRGLIVDARPITIGGSQNLSKNTAGLLGGGLAGGLLGSQIGGGRGRVVGGVAGALGGAALGSAAQRHLTKQPGMEYTVEIEGTGELVTIRQGKPFYRTGTQVKVIFPGGSSKGRPRVVPFNY